MKSRRGELFFRFRLWHVFLMSIWIAVVLSLIQTPHLAACTGALMVVLYLHHLSSGRTSPLAAFSFVIATILIAAVAGLPYVVREIKENKHQPNPARQVNKRKRDIDMPTFCTVTSCYGMAVAGIVTVFAAYENRDLWFDDF